MINFKEQDGELFRMLDKPVPLAPDSKMPCLVRLIQDDSPMGKHNKDLHAFDPERLTPKICTEVIDVNDLSDPNRGNAICDGFMSIQYYRYELIGTHVKEGSDDWALYHAINGEIVTMDDCGIYKIQDGKLWECFPNDSNEWRVVADDGYGYWLEYIHDNTGWQIYKEPKPEPKPLLADAKVGDLCKHRNGDWSQVIDTNGTYIQGQPIRTTLKDTNGINRNFCLSGSHFIMQFGGEYDIIHTEPLAHEGTAEWALQMWKLGNDIRNETGVVLMADYESEEIRVKHLVDVFPSGWQIYKEPEPQYKVGDWVEVECQNKLYHKQVLFVTENRVGFEFSGTTPSVCFDGTPSHIFKFIRKLSPSEVIVHIGCLSGTVVDAITLRGAFYLKHSDCSHSLISFTALDSHTRKLVESLLKAMQEEEK